jgi:hypothetical protein
MAGQTWTRRLRGLIVTGYPGPYKCYRIGIYSVLISVRIPTIPRRDTDMITRSVPI